MRTVTRCVRDGPTPSSSLPPSLPPVPVSLAQASKRRIAPSACVPDLKSLMPPATRWPPRFAACPGAARPGGQWEVSQSRKPARNCRLSRDAFGRPAFCCSEQRPTSYACRPSKRWRRQFVHLVSGWFGFFFLWRIPCIQFDSQMDSQMDGSSLGHTDGSKMLPQALLDGTVASAAVRRSSARQTGQVARINHGLLSA